jgi:hypothetical protein
MAILIRRAAVCLAPAAALAKIWPFKIYPVATLVVDKLRLVRHRRLLALAAGFRETGDDE